MSQIDAMSPMQRNKEAWQLQHSDAHIEHIVNQLIGCMADMDIHQFEAILNKQIQQNGLQQVVQGLIFSFLERVGTLWQVSHIHPVQEHIVSNIIRQKVIAAIDALPPVLSGRQVLLFLPEGEFHELGLLYVHYLLKSKNKAAIYLGASVPIEDIHYIINIK